MKLLLVFETADRYTMNVLDARPILRPMMPPNFMIVLLVGTTRTVLGVDTLYYTRIPSI